MLAPTNDRRGDRPSCVFHSADNINPLRQTHSLKLSKKASHSFKENDASFKDVRRLIQGLKDAQIKARKKNAIPFLPEPAPVRSLAPYEPLPTVEEKIEKHIRESLYTILEDIGNLEEKMKEMDAKACIIASRIK